MTHAYLNRARRYHNAIRAALMNEWDPIGVKGIAEASDEYDAYVSAIYKLLIEQCDRRELFNYLWWLETEHMGLTGDRQATGQFAERLRKLCEELLRTSPEV
jgi:hypothetical protein